MKTSLRLTKYLGGIVLALILIFTLPRIIVQRANITNKSLMEIVYLLSIIAILSAVIIGFGEKSVFHFSFKSFKDTFTIGSVMTAVTLFYLITNMYRSIKEYGTPLMDTKSVISFLITVFLGAGIREELLTRGFLLTFFKKAFGKSKASYLFAMTLSSLIFGAMHLSNLNGATNPTPIYAQIIYAVGIGFYLAALYLRTGNLWGNIVLHYLFDISLMVYPMIYANRNDMDVLIGEWLGNGIILKSILILIVSVLLGLYLIRDSKMKDVYQTVEN